MPTHHLRRQALVLIGTCVVAAATLPLAAQKKPPKSQPQSWPCQLTFRDAVNMEGTRVDAIGSDGQGTYVSGEDGNRVRCNIAQAPGTGHDGWLEFFIDADSSRFMELPAQAASTAYTKAGYFGFQNRGSFEVKVIRDATTIGQTYLLPFRSYVNHPQFAGGKARLLGNSYALAPADRWAADERGTSSVFVVPLDECSWQITSTPTHPITDGESATSPRVLRLVEQGKGAVPIGVADFALPFSATVRVTGVKPGCGSS